jgi:tetratricopeptide (TPR) repeat protein
MDQNNPVIQLCTAGTQAEFDGSMEAACELYRQAWEASTDDYEAYITAHYVACCQESPKETFRWNREALEQAKAIDDDSIKDFYPSLYLNMSRSYELLGNPVEAEKYYNMAAELGANHQTE